TPATSTPGAKGAESSGWAKRSTASRRVGDVRRVWRSTNSATITWPRLRAPDSDPRRRGHVEASGVVDVDVDQTGGGGHHAAGPGEVAEVGLDDGLTPARGSGPHTEHPADEVVDRGARPRVAAAARPRLHVPVLPEGAGLELV